MRIALVAPLFQSIPPKGYGGTERVLYFLIEELVSLGHDVTLYSVSGSDTSARLVSTVSNERFRDGLGNDVTGDMTERDFESYHVTQLYKVLSDITDYDVVHVHHQAYSLHKNFFDALPDDVRRLAIVWTDHVNLNRGVKPEVFKSLARCGVRVTTLSDSHNRCACAIPYIATVYNGIPRDLLHPTGVDPSYVAFLGQLSSHKGPIPAIRIAIGAGMPMKLAGTMTYFNRKYTDELNSYLERPDMEWIGEIGDVEKSDFLSGAKALIFPIQWDEPFGLVMIEAMACGTPVIAFNRGSVPEVIEDGVTGFVVDTEAEAIEKLKEVDKLDRIKIRQAFEQKFTAKIMAKSYVDVYERVCADAERESAKSSVTADVSLSGVIAAAEKATAPVSPV